MDTGELNAEGITVTLRFTNMLVASCYRNRDKLCPDVPLGTYADLTLISLPVTTMQ